MHQTNRREEQYVGLDGLPVHVPGARRVGGQQCALLRHRWPSLRPRHSRTSVGGQDVDQHGNEDSRDVSAFGPGDRAGIERGVTRNLSIKAEALRFLFDKNEPLAGLDEGCAPGVPGCLPAPSPGNFFAIDDGFLFRIGANWRLWSKYGEMYPYGARPDYLEMPAGPVRLERFPRRPAPRLWRGRHRRSLTAATG